MSEYGPSTSTATTIVVPSVANVTAGQLPPFPDRLDLNDHRKPLGERLQAFRISWQTFAQAVGVYEWSANRQKAMLMSVIGPAGAKVYRELQSARQQNTANNNNIDDDAYDDTAKGVDDQDLHRRSASGRVLAAIIRHLLSGDLRLRRMAAAKQIRYDYEPYWRFVVRLGVHIDACEYAERRDDVMLDRIIAGVNNVRVSKELCLMAELSLDAAIERCRLEDEVLNNNHGAKSKPSCSIGTAVTAASAKLVNKTNTNNTAKTPNRTDGKAIYQPTHEIVTMTSNAKHNRKNHIENRQQQLQRPLSEHNCSVTKCFRCGDHRLGHEHMANADTCPTQGYTCTKCGRLNHNELMCSN